MFIVKIIIESHLNWWQQKKERKELECNVNGGKHRFLNTGFVVPYFINRNFFSSIFFTTRYFMWHSFHWSPIDLCSYASVLAHLRHLTFMVNWFFFAFWSHKLKMSMRATGALYIRIKLNVDTKKNAWIKVFLCWLNVRVHRDMSIGYM